MWKNTDPRESMDEGYIVVVERFPDGGFMFIDIFYVQSGKVLVGILDLDPHPEWPPNWWWALAPEQTRKEEE